MINRKNKKLIATSAISASLCAALLIGSSFAWFTDKVVNEGNTIETGKLEIEAIAGDITSLSDGNYVTGKAWFLEKFDAYEGSSAPVIVSENWEPGQSDAKFIQIKNDGTLALDVSLTLTATNDENENSGLEDVIWFKLYHASVTGDTTGEAVIEGRFSDIETYLANPIQLLPWDGTDTNGDGEIKDIDKYTENTTVMLILEYGMDEEAGNEYQNKSFSADFNIVATQSTHEKDGFDSDQYDKDATYPGEEDTNTGDAFVDLKDGTEKTITLSTNTTVPTEAKVEGTNYLQVGNKLVIEGNGNTLDMNGMFFGIAQGCEEIVVKNVTITNIAGGTSPLFTMSATNPVKLTLDNVTVDAKGGYLIWANGSSTIAIDNCTFTDSVANGSYVNKVVKGNGAGTLTIDNTTVDGQAVKAENGNAVVK